MVLNIYKKILEEKMPEAKTGAETVRWSLDFLYSGIDDPQINADTAQWIEMTKKFHATYKGNLAEKLGEAIRDYSEISMLSNKIIGFLSLKQSTELANSAIKAKIAEIETSLNQASGEYLSFFEIEIVALDDATLEKLYVAEPIAAKHRPWIEHTRKFKPHFLSEEIEAALTKRLAFGAGAWSEFYDELEADMEFDFRGEKKTITEMLHILNQSNDREERSEAMKIINGGLGGTFAKYSAQNLYMVAGLEAVENKERGYKHPMENRNKSNRIPDEVVEALHRAVKDVAGPLIRRYYLLKAAHLGVEKLKWSDRNAPLPFSDNSVVPFDEAMQIVQKSFANFSPTLAEMVRDFMINKRIDAPTAKGKIGGAFNSSVVLPGGIPISFTLLNYIGSNRDVMTLAHELGHGVHGLLAGEAQGALMFHAPIAYCETASVFGELTTFNFLKERANENGDIKSSLALVMGKIDDIINTVVRQIGFSNFERRLHGMDSSYSKWERVKKMSVKDLDEIWLETTKRLYGEDGEVFTYENTEHLWAYISHFHRPFYVYGYAFGELLTHSLYVQRARLGELFESLYLDLLRSGSTKNVVELLNPFGLDPTDSSFWEEGIRISIGVMLEEAEKMSREIGVSI